ncbi:hypothetical protein KR009_002306, partial [Drosophila setifemur]
FYLIIFQIMCLIFLSIPFSKGFVVDRHGMVKRDLNSTLTNFGLSRLVSTILTPIANLADKVDLDIPYLSSFSSKQVN